MDPGKLKAQEFRNVAMFAGFSVIKAIEPVDAHALKVRRVWTYTIFCMRVIRLPKREFERLSEALIKRTARTLLDLWISAFGLRSCVYNIHVAICHMLEVKKS